MTVTQYLTKTVARNTFQVLVQANSGSRLVYTYGLKEFIDGTHTHGLDSLYQGFRVKDQQWLFGLDTKQVGTFIGEYGWKILEEYNGDEFANNCWKLVRKA